MDTEPYKMYAAILSAFLTSFGVTAAADLPNWANALITAVVAALAVYIVPNPVKSRRV